MTARVLALLLLAAPLATSAQQPVSAAPRTAADGHLLEIRDGNVLLDGVVLPDAAPAGLDLNGLTMSLDYSGPITPVVEVDGQAYVLERGHLVRFEESTRAGERVYALSSAMPDPSNVGAMDDDRLALVSQEAYFRELAERDRALYGRMQHEQDLEARVDALADQFRRTADSAERTRLRAELRDRLHELFALKQSLRREEVDRAQTELDAVRSQLDERDAQHEAIVERRLHGLCGD